MHPHWVDRVPRPAAPSIRTVALLLALTFALASPAPVVAQSGVSAQLVVGTVPIRIETEFAAFGQVTSGWDVLHRIHAQPANGQTMTSPVVVLRIVRR